MIKDGCIVECLKKGYVRRRVVAAARLPGQSTTDLLKAVRERDGKRLPGPVVRAGHLHGL